MSMVLSVICVLFAFTVTSFAANPNPVVGTWNGKLDVSGVQLRLAFNITDSSGALVATMDSPDQGAFDIPLDSVRVVNDSVYIHSAPMSALYKGLVTDDGTKLFGKWVQGGVSFDLILEKGSKLTINRPQEPKPPFKYNDEEVTSPNAKENNTLA